MKLSKKTTLLEMLYGVIYLLVSLALFFSFITYSKNDNSFFLYNSEQANTINLLGVAGAYLSDLFLRTFGSVVYFLPITFFLWSIKVCILKKPINWLNYFFLPVTLIFMSCFLAFISDTELLIFPESKNGFVGVGIIQYISIIQTSAPSLLHFKDHIVPLALVVLIIFSLITWGITPRTYLIFLTMVLAPLLKNLLYVLGRKDWYLKLNVFRKKILVTL